MILRAGNKSGRAVSNDLLSQKLSVRGFGMKLGLLNILVALFLGYGALEELIVRGVRGGEAQPFVIGAVGIVVSVLLAISGIALWRRRQGAWRLAFVAAVASVLFHVYAALPPHRNVGVLVLLVGAGYGLLLLVVGLSARGGKVQAA